MLPVTALYVSHSAATSSTLLIACAATSASYKSHIYLQKCLHLIVTCSHALTKASILAAWSVLASSCLQAHATDTDASNKLNGALSAAAAAVVVVAVSRTAAPFRFAVAGAVDDTGALALALSAANNSFASC